MVEGTAQDNLANKPVCDNLFKPASWLSKIDFINHLILFNNVLITVLAEKNGGKSSFASLLQANLDLQIQSCVINLQPSYDTQLLMEEISTGFAFEPPMNFSELVQQINENKSQCLLLIDDAQFLDKTWIKEALDSIKHQGVEGYFHLCLIADYSIVNALNEMAADFNNLVHTIELGGMNETETKTYIQYRARAENISSALLTDKLLGKIYQATAGDLAKIHANIGQYISDYMTPPAKSRINSLRNTGLTACFVLAASGLGYYLSHHGNLLGIGKNHETESRYEWVSQPVPATAEISVTLSSQLPSWHTGTRVKTARQDKSQVFLSSQQQELAAQTNLTVQKIPRVYEQMAPPSKLNPFPGFKRPKAMVEISKPSPKKPEVRAADKKLFTIQLLASHKIETVKHFMQDNGLKTKSKIYSLQEKNSQWFVLTFGEYSSLEAAKADMHELPARLTALHPWIRPTKGLKIKA